MQSSTTTVGPSARGEEPTAGQVLRRRTPLTVSLRADCELVVRGLGELLAPYDRRVRLLLPVPRISQPSDVVLVDPWVGPGGMDHLVRARRSAPIVAVYTWDVRPERVAAAYAAGACGFLPKTLPGAELVAALERLADPGRSEFLNLARPTAPTDPKRPAHGRPGRPSGRAAARTGNPATDLLTAREAEVVALVATGLSNLEIAEAMFLSTNTIKSYIRSAYRKMGVRSRSQAVRWALHHGLGARPTASRPTSATEPASGAPDGPGPGPLAEEADGGVTRRP